MLPREGREKAGLYTSPDHNEWDHLITLLYKMAQGRGTLGRK
jgi:hypothetical protein